MHDLLCHNCGAEYSIEIEQESVDGNEPAHCPFCGELLDDYIEDEDQIEELDFEDDE